jgi:transcriptional regulator with GAF, ATPase, and Fis domain
MEVEMARSMLVVVSDDHLFVENSKSWARSQGVEVQVYSTYEWQSRSAAGTNLSAGSSPVEVGAKILPFPGPNQSAPVRTGQKVQTINEMESVAIEKAIHEFNGNLTEAAKALGIGRATLYRKVKQYNIDPSMARRKRAA